MSKLQENDLEVETSSTHLVRGHVVEMIRTVHARDLGVAMMNRLDHVSGPAVETILNNLNLEHQHK